MNPGLIDLGRDEEVIAVVRKSILLEISRFFFGLVWIFLPFFFFFPIMRLGTVGIVFFLITVLSGLLYLIRIWNIWRLSILVVTDRRIIDIHQTGIMKKEIHELRCVKIRSVRSKKIGVVGVFNLGALRIHSKKSQEFDIEFYGVKQPDHVRELILEVKCLRKEHLKKIQEKSKQSEQKETNEEEVNQKSE